jgi:polysaccharide biosynthesis transport protein
MLQTAKTSTLANRGAQPSAPGLDYISLDELFKVFTGFLQRQYRVVVLVFLAIIALTFTYLLTTPPSFTALAKLMIDTRKLQLFQQQSVLGEAPADPGLIDSQIEVLQSENVALAVIKQLHLTEDPQFLWPRPGLFSAIKGSALGLVVSLFQSSGGPVQSSGGEASNPEFALTRAAIERLQSQLIVSRVGLTYIISIGFRAQDPQRAAKIANAVADAYIVDQLEAKYQATLRAGTWMQDRIKELRAQATYAERAVEDFKTKNNIIAAGGRLMHEQQLSELNSSLVQARALTAETKAKLDRIDEILRSGVEVPDATVTDRLKDATVTDTLKNEVINKLRSQYLDFARQEAEFSAKYGAKHIAVINLRTRMREIRKVIIDEVSRIAQTYRSDYEIAKAREESLTKSLAEIVSVSQTTNQAQIMLRDLESSAQTYRQLHDNFLQRYMESVQQQSFPISEARVITSATPPMGPSNPRTLFVLMVGAAGGVIAGFGLGLLRDIKDQVFRTSDQVKSILQTDCIALLPKVKGPVTSRSDQPRRDYGGLEHRIIKRDQSPFWTVIDSPCSRFAESIRAIKIAADLNTSVNGSNVLAFTASLPNEGKSTVAVALAQSIANAGGRVVLLDADLRNPGLSRKLIPEAKVGLLEVLAKQATIEDALCLDPDTHLTFLPAVVNGRMADSSNLLASENTKMLFERLRRSYEYIIVDLPPLAPLVDVRAVTHLVDSFVLVIEWGRTKIDVVEHSLRIASGVYDNLLGVVLNKTDLNMLRRHESHRRDYYFNRYYGRYGYLD